MSTEADIIVTTQDEKTNMAVIQIGMITSFILKILPEI